MGRAFAGVLGSLAMTVVICRGTKDAAGVEGTLILATVSLIVFAAIGAIIGAIAQVTIDESVRTRLQLQLDQGASQVTNQGAA